MPLVGLGPFTDWKVADPVGQTNNNPLGVLNTNSCPHQLAAATLLCKMSYHWQWIQFGFYTLIDRDLEISTNSNLAVALRYNYKRYNPLTAVSRFKLCFLSHSL